MFIASNNHENNFVRSAFLGRNEISVNYVKRFRFTSEYQTYELTCLMFKIGAKDITTNTVCVTFN